MYEGTVLNIPNPIVAIGEVFLRAVGTSSTQVFGFDKEIDSFVLVEANAEHVASAIVSASGLSRTANSASIRSSIDREDVKFKLVSQPTP